MGTANDTLFEEVVSTTYKYLGPAADRFVARQVSNHLEKSPKQLQKQDLANLIIWLKVSMAHLSEDTKMVQKYTTELKSLANGKKKTRGRTV
jgi:hypothetical protein